MPVIVLPYIPSTITVHLGLPDQWAENVTVSFPDYVKNVASSEIYPTWELSTIRANVLAIISFALNRVYTEFYPSRGYNFQITNTTAYDQKFIRGRSFFQSISAVVDEIFNDYIRRQVTECRSDKVDPSTGAMDILNRIPRFVSKAAIHFLMWLDKHGWVPADIIATDPYYSSVVISNLGSIKLKCGYHHLTNWGTCSLFCIIGEKAVRPIYAPDGTMTMKETLDLGLTIDERLADGYYYSKSVRLLKHLLEHPEELEKPMKEEVIYE